MSQHTASIPRPMRIFMSVIRSVRVFRFLQNDPSPSFNKILCCSKIYVWFCVRWLCLGYISVPGQFSFYYNLLVIELSFFIAYAFHQVFTINLWFNCAAYILYKPHYSFWVTVYSIFSCNAFFTKVK